MVSVKQYALFLLCSIVVVGLVLLLIYQEEVNQAIGSSTKKNAVTPSVEKLVPETKLEPNSKMKHSVKEGDVIEEGEEAERESLVDKQAILEADSDSQLSNMSLPQIKEDVDLTKEPVVVEETVNPINIAKTDIDSSIDKKLNIEVSVQMSILELTSDELQLSDYLESHYMLQWVALSSFSSANQFRNRHPLKAQMMIFRKKKQQGFLYLLMSGPFESKSEASIARNTYIKKGYKGKPWVKSVAAIKKDIRLIQQ